MNNYQGFYKVNERGLSHTIATFFNPSTKESFEKMVWDFDDERVELENLELYELRINEKVKALWEHHIGMIKVGDLVQINRGRKFKGEQKRVAKTFTYKVSGTYGFSDVDYLVFEDGTKVAEYNCDLVKEYERYAIQDIRP